MAAYMHVRPDAFLKRCVSRDATLVIILIGEAGIGEHSQEHALEALTVVDELPENFERIEDRGRRIADAVSVCRAGTSKLTQIKCDQEAGSAGQPQPAAK